MGDCGGGGWSVVVVGVGAAVAAPGGAWVGRVSPGRGPPKEAAWGRWRRAVDQVVELYAACARRPGQSPWADGGGRRAAGGRESRRQGGERAGAVGGCMASGALLAARESLSQLRHRRGGRQVGGRVREAGSVLEDVGEA